MTRCSEMKFNDSGDARLLDFPLSAQVPLKMYRAISTIYIDGPDMVLYIAQNAIQAYHIVPNSKLVNKR